MYLAYAGPYSASPSSAFGHLFLILQPGDETPIPLWDVVSFNADTEDAGFLRYFMAGIGGGFYGSYKTNKFHEKVREYEVLEDRDLWLIRLKLTKQERALLQDSLTTVVGRRYPYTFFSRNCAYYLQLLISDVLPLVPRPTGRVSPVEVLELTVKLGLADVCYFRPSLSQRLALESNALSSSVADKLKEVPWRELAADQAWLRSLNPVDREIVQERFSLATLRLRQPVEPEVSKGLALLRVLSGMTTVESAPVDGQRTPGQPIPAPDFHAYGRLTVSYAEERRTGSSVALRYRTALHEVDDPWLGYRPVNTLSALAVTLSGNPDLTHIRLREFSLFSQRSLAVPAGAFKSPTWLLDLGGKRGGIFDAASMHSGLRFGSGWARSLASGLHAYAIATMALVGARHYALTFSPGCQIGVLYLGPETWRCGAEWNWECDVTRSSRDIALFDAWLRHDMGTTWGTAIHVRSDSYSGGLGFRVNIDWYP